METNEELENELKKHLKAIRESMPLFSKDEQLKIITQAINESKEVPQEKKEETIKMLSNINF